MRLEQLHVDGFGKLHDRDFTPDPGLTLVRGLNEAGKTSLLGFIRAVLFGFDGSHPQALAGGKRAGRIRIRMADGRWYWVERYGDKKGQGTLKVTAEDGKDRTGALPDLLQKVDSALFGNVFAFGLGELASFDNLSGTDVASRIYGAGLGIGNVNPVDVEKRLQAKAEELYKGGGSKPLINELMGRLEGVEKTIRELQLAATFETTSQELQTAQVDRDALVARLGTLDARVARAGRQAACWEAWQDLLDAEAARAAMGSVALLPAEVATELGTAIRGRDDAAANADALREARGARERAVNAIVVNDAVLARRADLTVIATEAIKSDERATRLREHERAAAEAGQLLDLAMGRLGQGWDAARVGRFDDSMAVTSELNGRLRTLLGNAEVGLTAARAAQTAAAGAARTAAADLQKAQEQLAALADPEGAPSVEGLERSLGQVRDAAGDRTRAAQAVTAAEGEVARVRGRLDAAPLGRTWNDVQVDAGRLLQAIRDEATARGTASILAQGAAAADQGTVPRATTPLPWWAVVLIGVALGAAFFVVGQPLAGVIAVLAGLGMAVATRRPAARVGAPAAGTASAAAAAERALAEILDRRARLAGGLGLAADATEPEVDVLAARAKAALAIEDEVVRAERAVAAAAEVLRVTTQALASAAAVAGLPLEPSSADVDGLARIVRDRRDRAASRATATLRVTEATATEATRREELERADAALREAEAASEAATADWTGWLERHDLSGVADRETAQQVVAEVTRAKSEIAKVDRAQAAIAEQRAAGAAFATAASALAVDLGLRDAALGTADGGELARLLATLAESLAAAVAADARRTSAREGLVVATSAAAQADALLADAEAALATLLGSHGVADAEALRVALDRSAAARLLDERVAAATRVLVSQSGPGEALAAFREELGAIFGRHEIDEAMASATAERDEAKAAVTAAGERIGGLRTAVEKMLRDASDSVQRQEREDLLGRLDEKSRDWAVLSVARHLLHSSRKRYESAHRPAVLGIAERYFSTWTQGRFTRIIAPMGSVIESVERDTGEQVPLGGLSLGTAQQLYLAVRFGLVEHFAQSAEPLPLVMDDILVNFDPERAALTAESIRELAKTHQVLYFTCHKEVPLVPDQELTLPRL